MDFTYVIQVYYVTFHIKNGVHRNNDPCTEREKNTDTLRSMGNIKKKMHFNMFSQHFIIDKLCANVRRVFSVELRVFLFPLLYTLVHFVMCMQFINKVQDYPKEGYIFISTRLKNKVENTST